MNQKIGFSLVAVGLLILVGWSVQGFFMASDIPLIVRIAVGAIGIGFVFLLVSVLRDRFAAAKDEDFRGVER